MYILNTTKRMLYISKSLDIYIYIHFSFSSKNIEIEETGSIRVQVHIINLKSLSFLFCPKIYKLKKRGGKEFKYI